MLSGSLGEWLVALLRRLDPETAHRVTIRTLASGLVPAPRTPQLPASLSTRVLGFQLAHPIGLAAGFDKDGEAFAGLGRIGAGFVEVGTVTPRPQPGNPRPRVFRLEPDAAVINRYGFNNQGLAAVRARLARRRPGSGVVGANVGANKGVRTPEADYAAGVAAMAPVADYLVVNVSSPNTPGLRDLQDPAPLAGLLRAALEARDAAAQSARPPLLLKIAPDLDDGRIAAIVETAIGCGVDGLIVSNTTVARPASLVGEARGEAGGLSGRPLFETSTRVLAVAARAAAGRVPLIGVGGVEDGRTAFEKIRAGASLVQLYTALVYRGPGLFLAVARELAALLEANGFVSVGDAVGSGVDEWADRAPPRA